MCQQWTLHEGALPMVFSEEQKQTIQDLTGQMPILLHILTEIHLGTSDSGDFTKVLQKLWKCPKVRPASEQISKLILEQCTILQDIVRSITYVYTAFSNKFESPTDSNANGQ